MNIESITDFVVKVILPILGIIGPLIGWFANSWNRKRNKEKDVNAMMQAFQEGRDKLYVRLHEYQEIDLETSNKNNQLRKEKQLLVYENEAFKNEIEVLRSELQTLSSEIKALKNEG